MGIGHFKALILVLSLGFAPIFALAKNLDTESPAPPSGQYVKSIDDFNLHTQLHISRMVMIAIFILDKFYPEVDRDLALGYFKSHDHIKVRNWLQPNSLLRRLYKHYGHLASNTLEVKELTRQMADYEQIFAKKYFGDRNHYGEAEGFSKTAQIILLIEKLADVSDRGTDKVASEEFGRQMQSAIAYLHLEEASLPWRAVKNVELNYQTLTKNLHYRDWTGCRMLLGNTSEFK